MTASANGTRQHGVRVIVTGPSSWREERRLDRLAAAQADRESKAAEVQARIAEADARDRRKREERRSRQAERRAARTRRADRMSARTAWLREHVTALLFVPVIAVPGVLAWTAMASYGATLYGRAGFTLPAFSEGAMWAFAAAVTITPAPLPRTPGLAPAARHGPLRSRGRGTELHPRRGPRAGPARRHRHRRSDGARVGRRGNGAPADHGLGPRRSRAGRSAARTDRAVARRERAIRRAALRRAVAVLDAAGNARLVHAPGTVTLTRRRGRLSLGPVPHAPVWLPWPMVLPGGPEQAVRLGDLLADEAVAAYMEWRSGQARGITLSLPGDSGSGRPVVAWRQDEGDPGDTDERDDDSAGRQGDMPPGDSDDDSQGHDERHGSDSDHDKDGDTERDTDIRKRQPSRDRKAASGRALAAALLKRYPSWTDDKVAARAGVSLRTVQRAREAVRRAAADGRGSGQ